ncbi:MAG: hypothetical protein KC474_10655, partial [Cyanobacteria bacterium HKST-UBA04]|nr:hypothetical protein [Cyanobacteria bacterium HKST-UBA04]
SYPNLSLYNPQPPVNFVSQTVNNVYEQGTTSTYNSIWKNAISTLQTSVEAFVPTSVDVRTNTQYNPFAGASLVNVANHMAAVNPLFNRPYAFNYFTSTSPFADALNQIPSSIPSNGGGGYGGGSYSPSGVYQGPSGGGYGGGYGAAPQQPAYPVPQNLPIPQGYGQPQMPYGQPQMPYGQPQMPYGQPQIPYGQPQLPYDPTQMLYAQQALPQAAAGGYAQQLLPYGF